MKFSTFNQLLRHYGAKWVAYRVWKSASERLGYWKLKLPSKPWDHFGSDSISTAAQWSSAEGFFSWRREQGVRFFFDPQSIDASKDWLRSLDPENDWSVSTLARIRKGEFPYFSARWIDIGFPPNWALNPYSGKSAPNDGHFSQIDEFGFGDVKAIWETSRFGFVFYLVRGYARTGNDQFAETYWELLENWMDSNLPYEGINWKCGQESGLRFLAAIFGLFVFSKSSATTPKRLNRFAQFAAATANRIDKHIAYAISQKNNHGISEAVALWSIGVLFPELKRSAAWQAKGLKVLVQLCDELIYEDGAFSQHSVNYHRLVLHLLAWNIRLAEANSIQLPHSIVDSFRRATRFVSALVAGNHGEVPRYGNDDGAKLFALDHCDYSDFRPLVQLCQAIAFGQRSVEAGPWDEGLFWFSIKECEAVEQPMSPGRKSFPDGGIHRIHLGNTTAFVRGGKFRHRPTQSDQMHVDVWWKGHNIAIDPGTYSYNGESDWRQIPFMKSQFHNSVLVDGKEPEQQVSKFLLLPWNDSVRVVPKECPKFLAMEWSRKLSFGLENTVEHHRAVSVLPNDTLVVIDGLWSQGEHRYQLNWLLGEKEEDWDLQGKLKGKLRLQIDSSDYYVHVRGNGKTELDCKTGVEGSTRGWFAPHYLERQPALSCQLKSQGRNVLFLSLFSPRDPHLAQLESISFPSITEPECLLDSGFISQINKAINE